MLDFQPLKLSQREAYESILFACPPRGCEYSFANLYLWGQQRAVFTQGCVAFFSHFDGRTIYPYPVGNGDKRAVVEAVLHDAQTRGIPCRFSSLTQEDRLELESWFPDRFYFSSHRGTYDYVYAIDDLADLKGRRFQKKRNHTNRFRAEHPDYQIVELTACNMAQVQPMVNDWYVNRRKTDPDGHYMLESIAMARAFRHYEGLGMEGLVLMDGGQVLAVTMGTQMGPDTFDIHFEKAREDVDGSYPMINQEFARYLRQKHPQIQFLNREDDVGLEGLRKAKLSYNPHHLVEKYRASCLEDIYELR